MIWPNCKSENTIVTDSRPSGEYRRRRLHCYNCDANFTTYEIQAYEMKLLNEIRNAFYECEEKHADKQ